MNVAMGTIRAANLRDRIRERGGRVVWAVLDSGISQRHMHFRRHQNLVLPAGLEHVDLTASSKKESAPLRDEVNHGTLIAGIVAGEMLEESSLPLPSSLAKSRGSKKSAKNGEAPREISGVAPSCRLLSIKVLGSASETQESILVAALQKIQAMNDFGRVHRIHGVVVALGGDFDAEAYPCGMSPLCVEIDRLVRMGVCVVVAAGNEGLDLSNEKGISGARMGSISDPGNADLAITVGSTHREIPEIAGISYFSGKGPTRDGRRKPDLVAPGEKIRCCHANETAQGSNPTFDFQGRSGTPFAAAMVAGAAAALQSAYPHLIGHPLEVKRILMDSATDLKRDPNFQGRGLLNLEAAFALAQQRMSSSPLTESPLPVANTAAPTVAPTPAPPPTKPAEPPRRVRLMCSYAYPDLTLWEELQKHLAGLKHQGLLETWHDQEIEAGKEWKEEIDQRLESSDVFLLMVSSHFLASDYCWNVELKHILQRHKDGTAVVIPVIARPCDWETTPFAKLDTVPRKGKQAVTLFGDQHEAWSEVTKKVRAAVERLAANLS